MSPRPPTDDDADPIDRLLNDPVCGKLYAAIGECLAANKRDFRLCQAELPLFRDCHEAEQRRKRAAQQ